MSELKRVNIKIDVYYTKEDIPNDGENLNTWKKCKLAYLGTYTSTYLVSCEK